jgi:flagellar basal body-associated protein FliL
MSARQMAWVGAVAVLMGLVLALVFGVKSGLIGDSGLQLPFQSKIKRQAAPSANFFYMEPLVLNGNDSADDVTSYIRLTLTLELDRPERAADVKARLAAVENVVMLTAASRESRALRSAEGKAGLREELTQSINALLPRGGVRAVYFADFFIGE